MNAYLDSSVIVRYLTKEDGYIATLQSISTKATSVISHIECYRALDRMRLLGEISESELVRAKAALKLLLQATDRINLDDYIVLAAKAPYSIMIRSLDAIHLATALEWQRELEQPVTVLSHDKKMLQLARYVGLEVLDDTIS